MRKNAQPRCCSIDDRILSTRTTRDLQLDPRDRSRVRMILGQLFYFFFNFSNFLLHPFSLPSSSTSSSVSSVLRIGALGNVRSGTTVSDTLHRVNGYIPVLLYYFAPLKNGFRCVTEIEYVHVHRSVAPPLNVSRHQKFFKRPIALSEFLYPLLSSPFHDARSPALLSYNSDSK